MPRVDDLERADTRALRSTAGNAENDRKRDQRIEPVIGLESLHVKARFTAESMMKILPRCHALMNFEDGSFVKLDVRIDYVGVVGFKPTPVRRRDSLRHARHDETESTAPALVPVGINPIQRQLSVLAFLHQECDSHWARARPSLEFAFHERP